jgi:hypothetical protein
MTELPPPDVLDRRGRMNRLVMSLGFGVGCALATYALVYWLAGRDYEQRSAYGSTYHAQNAGRFIFYFTGLAFIVGCLVMRALLERRAKRLERDAAIPKAKTRA